MSIQNKLVDMKLRIRVEDTSTGETKVKNLNFTRIKRVRDRKSVV